MKIAVLGLWHLGETYAACLAELGNKVIGIDENIAVIDNLNKAKPPLEEPKLRNLLNRNIKKGKLSFTADYEKVTECDVVWITIDTPVDNNDNADIKPIQNVIKKVFPYLKENQVIVVSSQLPAGTSSVLLKFLNKKRKNIKLGYAYVPENLRLGEAVDSFMNASRVVIGADDDLALSVLKQIYKSFEKESIYMSVISAEMVKHATNSFLATSLSFIYDISDVSEKLGADVMDVTKALKADSRIGQGAYLDVSTGFSGGTLARDLQYLITTGKNNKLNLPVISSVMSKNNLRRKIIYDKVGSKLGSFKNKTITIFGLTYKYGTSTLRRSLPLTVAKEIVKLGGTINLYDPYVTKEDIIKEFGGINFDYFCDPYESVKNSMAVICITPAEAYKILDYRKISNLMKNPKVFFDSRNYFKEMEEEFKKLKISYMGVGR